jgi:hypothetical protein
VKKIALEEAVTAPGLETYLNYLGDEQREKICHRNAEHLMQL